MTIHAANIVANRGVKTSAEVSTPEIGAKPSVRGKGGQFGG
jgi:hypothetical protein